MKIRMNNLKMSRGRPLHCVVVAMMMVGLMLLGGAPQALAGPDDATIAFDGFESKNFTGGEGWLAKWTKKGGVRLVKNKPYDGKRYAYITGGKTPGYLERTVDLSNVTAARLKFAGRVKSFENKDKAYVKVSPDGDNYTTVAEFTPSDSDNQWHLHDIDLSAFTMSADFRIVFEGAMGRKDKDKWFLDNIEISDTGSGITFNLDADVLGRGSVNLDPSGGNYAEGTPVELTAQPETGWVFDHWEGDVSGSANPVTVTMDSDKTATAVFTEAVTYRLDTTTNGQGSVSLNPAGGQYTDGTVVTLTANPASGWAFAGWTGDVSGMKNPTTIVMNNDKTVEAAFTETSTETWKFIIYGDTRSNDSAHRSVLRSIVQNTPDYRFLINVGDVVSTGSSTSQWNTWQRAVDDILGGSGQSSVPPKYMSAIGNHDTSGMTNWKKFLPGQNQQFGNGGKFFTFDYGNARFVVLNSEQSLTGSQLTMLKKAINENPKTWLFTVWHRPIFPFGAKSYESNIHKTWGKRLYDGGGDIMFMGHAHYYVRTGKIGLDGTSKPPMDAQNGTVQVVTGMGGAPPYSVSPNADGYGYMAESWNNKYGYTELTVTGNTLTLKQILSNGRVFDTETYTANPKRSLDDAAFDDQDAEVFAEPSSEQTETLVEPEPEIFDAEIDDGEEEVVEVE